MVERGTEFAYDVFISYSHADKEWVWGWLVPRLKEAGLAVCTDRESFDVGVPALVNMENAVAASRHTLLVLTPAWVDRQWTTFESLLVQHEDPVGLLQRTLPVLHQRCDPPRRIAMLTYADLTGDVDVEVEFAKLLDALRGVRRLVDAHSISVGQTRPSAAESVAAVGQLPDSRTRSDHSLSTIRRRLNQTFDDPGLDAFCLDHFPEVYDRFGRGMRKDEKLTVLLDHCRRWSACYQELLVALRGQAR